MKRTIKVGFDFDGVIADSHSLKPSIAKKMFGVDIEGPFSRENVVSNQLTLDQYNAVKKELYFGVHQILPMKDSLYYIGLLQRNCTLRIITSRSGDTLIRAFELLQKYDINMPVIGVGYGKPKNEACVGLDVYIDDDIEKLLPLIGKVKHLLLFTQPENMKESQVEGIVRVNNWFELYFYIWNEV